VQIVIDTYTAITETFMPLVNLLFFIPALPYDSSSVCSVSEEGLYSRTQNFMFSHSLTDILKCDEPTIHRNKQTADT
jgi:hypothetical protein